MKLSEFNLLEIDIFNGENLVYSGMSENVPEDLKNTHIKITGIDGKKVITQIDEKTSN